MLFFSSGIANHPLAAVTANCQSSCGTRCQCSEAVMYQSVLSVAFNNIVIGGYNTKLSVRRSRWLQMRPISVLCGVTSVPDIDTQEIKSPLPRYGTNKRGAQKKTPRKTSQKTAKPGTPVANTRHQQQCFPAKVPTPTPIPGSRRPSAMELSSTQLRYRAVRTVFSLLVRQCSSARHG